MELLKSLIFDWQNAVFSASIVFWLVYLFFVMQSGVSETEVGPDFSHDLDHDIDHDVDHDIDVGHGVIDNVLGFLGVGRCPLSIILLVFGNTWGFIGLCCNGIFSSISFIPAGFYFWPSLFVATILGLFITRYTSLTVAKVLPKQASSAVSLTSLVGKHGEASVQISATGGRAKVRDQHGTLHNIYCRVAEGEKPVHENEEIIVLQYLQAEKVFIVQKKPTLPEVKHR
ncbi:MAG: YqiJ family protein [Deltaproteobacteria bacterium]|nr:YqiJ family protein [Deltaproteobacteria bacterium]